METSDAAQVLLEVKDLANNHLGHIELLRQQYEDGDDEALAASMTTFIDGVKDAKKIDPNIDLGIPGGFYLDQIDEQKISANELVQFYNPEMMGLIYENSQHLVNVLDQDLLSSLSRNLKANSNKASRNDFDFGPRNTDDNARNDDPFGFGPNKWDGSSFNPHSFSSTSMFKNMKRVSRSHFKVPFSITSLEVLQGGKIDAAVSKKVINVKSNVIQRILLCHFGNAIAKCSSIMLLVSHRMILQ